MTARPNIYKRIPTLKGILASPGRNGIGRLGEHLACLLLEKRGYKCSFAQKGSKRGDLRVVDPETGAVQRVEVKTARKSSDGKWRFLLWKKDKQDYRHADYILLLAVWISGEVTCFTIPVADLGERSQICISSHPLHYTGRWATYRQTPSGLSLNRGDHDQLKPECRQNAKNSDAAALRQPGHSQRDPGHAERPVLTGPSANLGRLGRNGRGQQSAEGPRVGLEAQ